MSIGDRAVCVRILDKEYKVGCTNDQERALRDSAEHLDKQMRLIRQNGRVLGLERIAVMAALNITNEFLKLQQAAVEKEKILFERISLLEERIDGALMPRDMKEHS